MAVQTNTHVPAPERSVALWAGVLGGPAIWAIQLQVGYALSPIACGSRTIIEHGLTLVCVFLALGGAFLSFRDWRAAGLSSPDETDGGALARTRFLGAMGVLLA